MGGDLRSLPQVEGQQTPRGAGKTRKQMDQKLPGRPSFN